MNIKDFKWTEKRFGTRFATILKKLGGLSKDATDGSIDYKDDQGNVTKLVTDSTFSSLLAKNGLIKVKWQELKDKRDNGQLIPGSLYRITDYNCTTTQENTQSAGHQFDIVLLALSENKLAEEGWAMEHPTDVYDVTFIDGVTKKCYLYITSIVIDILGTFEYWNLIDVDTMLGTTLDDVKRGVQAIVDEDAKTIIMTESSGASSEFLTQPDLQYSYFQNSNLSAWKVWYCLDNDKSRFAWAQEYKEAEFESFEFNNTIYTPSINGATGNQVQVTINGSIYYQYENISVHAQVLASKNSTNIQVGDTLYTQTGPTTTSVLGTVEKINATPAQEEGRGVIYRLIDEFNNDVAYDFKNIQFVRKLTDGALDTSTGTDTWCYTFNYWEDNTSYEGSVVVSTSEDWINGINNNKVGLRSQQFDAWILPDNVLLGIASDDDFHGYSNCSFYNSWDCTIDGDCTDIQIDSSNRVHVNYSAHLRILRTQNISLSEDGSIIIAGKKVLTET